jgi:hypothetical protein
MKKILLLASIVGISGLAQATTINAPSSLVGANVMDGNNAYSWGISIAVPTGQTVSSAEIDFSSVTLTASGNPQGTGVLYTDLLNSKATGVTTATDGDAPGDYWATKYSGANISSLKTENFAYVGNTLTWSDVLTTSELASLNSYLTANNGVFDIGLDPDCHFSVGGLSFTYTLTPTQPHTVPDVATTAFLLVIGLAGLEVFRRQFTAAKMKA